VSLYEAASPDTRDVTLAEVVEVLRRNRWLAIAFIMVATIGTGLLVGLLPKTYTAKTVISPVSNTPSLGSLGALGALGSEFGGLASLAGLSMSGDSKKWESVAVLESEDLTEKYIQENKLLPVLYEHDWDPRRMTWRTSDPKKVPTLWKANRLFASSIRTVAMDNKTGLVTVSIAWHDPQLAAKWANDLVSRTNEYLRNKAIAEAERNIAYLNDQAAKTTIVEAKQAIYTILQTELNKAMLARGNEQYAFRVLDPARAPERASSLGRAAAAAIALIASLVITVLAAFLRISWKKI
jgi:uncharacterized protein involved in exopolysaccharide biosynthesis